MRFNTVTVERKILAESLLKLIALDSRIRYPACWWKIIIQKGTARFRHELIDHDVDVERESAGSRAMDNERWATLAAVEVPINLVMVVDDEADSASVLKAILERQGFKVRIAKEGGQAQATFVMQKPDFVILDLILPGESGFEICERLKHTDETVPVLIVTAIDLPESRELAQKVGADGYLTKPYDPAHLIARMREVAKAVWERTHLDQEPDPMRVRFICSCGKKFKVSSTHRGKSLTCPSCGEPVAVPRT